jgi:hypothetical protein
MTTIDPRQRIANLLHARVGSRGRTAAAGAQPATRASLARAAPDVASLAAGRMQALSADDPKRKEKALGIFLETVLLQEFGAQLAGDPSFADLLAAVQDQMRADPHVCAAADELAGILLGSKGVPALR